MNDIVLISKDDEVKKSEVLVKSRYKLKPLAIKLITSLISAVQDKDTPEQEYIFSVANFVNMAEVKGNAYYKELDKATDELYKPLKINVNGRDWTKINWVTTCKYIDREGIIKFKLHPDILPLIKNLKKGNYLKYDLENILKLRGEYSIRVYELLKDELNKNGRYSRNPIEIFTIQYLRDTLEIPKSYRYDNIKKQILLVAQKNLSKYTDIRFDFEEIKIGKAVHSLKFKIYPNIKNIKENIKLPTYLHNKMSYVNYLRDKYRGNLKYFFRVGFNVKDKKDTYFFGINNKNLIYANSNGGGMGITLSKKESETIYKISYLCSLHSELYRNLIADEIDFRDLFKNDMEFAKEVDAEIKQVIQKHFNTSPK
jgi:plasmid replication initiation protein